VTARLVFVTGGTGYIGSRVIPALVARGHDVRALVRASSSVRLASGCTPVIGNALDSTTSPRASLVATRSSSVEAPPASERLRERILTVPDIRRGDVTR
jgi:uncharacterized protein YbjT (DUF2867 family)